MAPFDTLLERLRAAGEATRLRALVLLSHGELTVSELSQILNQSQPRVSRHLKVLAEAGLVERHQEGAWVFYRLSADPSLAALGIVPARASVFLLDEDKRSLDALRDAHASRASSYFAAHAAEWEAVRTRHIDDDHIERAMLDLAGEPVQNFVDLGTGTGRMLVVFKEHYERGVGFDLSPEMLTLARTRLMEESIPHAQVRRSNFLIDPLPEGVDLFCLHHVLHFLTEPRKAIAAATSVLSSDGRILIADFAPHTHEDLRDDHAHRRLGFDDRDIERWAHESGLHITASQALEPPDAGGLITRLWRLEFSGSSRRQKSQTVEKETPSHAIA